MNKKMLVGILLSAMLVSVLVASVAATEWGDYVKWDSPKKIEFTGVDPVETETVDEDGNPVIVESETVNTKSLNYALFEQYGPLLLILALLMFGAMIGGVCIAREEGDSSDTD